MCLASKWQVAGICKFDRSLHIADIAMAGVLSNVSGLSQTLWAQVFRQKPDGRRHPPGYAASRSTRHGLGQKLPSTRN